MPTRKPLLFAALFGLLHFLNDFLAGYLLAVCSQQKSWEVASLYVMIYGILAFGGQLLVAIGLDNWRRLRFFVQLSLGFLAFAAISFYLNIGIAIVLSGIASAFIHVSGGTAVVLQQARSPQTAGIFAAPGVLGLIAGGIMGNYGGWLYVPMLLAGVLLVTMAINRYELPSYPTEPLDNKNQTPKIQLHQHDALMLLLLLAIAMRSMLWNVAHLIAQKNELWLWSIAWAAFAGKLLGGWIAQRSNWRLYVLISSTFAAILLSLGSDNLYLLCLGVASLQSSVPVAWIMLQQYLPNNQAAGVAISLGVAIILSGLPMYLTNFSTLITQHTYFIVCVAIVMFGTNAVAARSYKH